MVPPPSTSAGSPRATPQCLGLGPVAVRPLGDDSVLGGRRPSRRFDGPGARPPHRRSIAARLPQACARPLTGFRAWDEGWTWERGLPGLPAAWRHEGVEGRPAYWGWARDRASSWGRYAR